MFDLLPSEPFVLAWVVGNPLQAVALVVVAGGIAYSMLLPEGDGLSWFNFEGGDGGDGGD